MERCIMSNLAHLADRIFDTPLLISQQKARTIMSVLGPRMGLDINVPVPDANRFEGESAERDKSGRVSGPLPYMRTKEGVAIISIVGTLVNRGAYIGANSGVVSYEGIQYQLKRAGEDDKAHSVVLDLQTPGGEAVGAFETAEMVRTLSTKKKVVAIINGMAASAGYAIAASATEIVTTQTGLSGSIGVVLMHADFSRKLNKQGIDPTFIFAGKHKVDGNPFAPLSKDVRERLQADVEAFYTLFVESVSKGRGRRLTADMARKTEALTFMGKDAVTAGLADRVGSFDSVLASLSKTILPNQPKRNTPMSTELDQARAEGASQERTRIMSIANNEKLAANASAFRSAIQLAADAPDMSADKVVEFAMKTAKEEAPVNNPASLQNRLNQPDTLGELLSNGQQSQASETTNTLPNASEVFASRRKAKAQPADGQR
jgi:signal peptide peptidase SppA